MLSIDEAAVGMPERSAWDVAWERTPIAPFSETRTIILQYGLAHRLLVSDHPTAVPNTYSVTITTDAPTGGMDAVHKYDLDSMESVLAYLRQMGYPISPGSAWQPYNASAWSSMMRDLKEQGSSSGH